MEITDFYCITENSGLIHLGEANSFEEAESIAETRGIAFIWIFNQETANMLIARLNFFRTMNHNDKSRQIPGQVLPSNQIQ